MNNRMAVTGHCKLILVEGIPGSGKTSLATFIRQLLDKAGVPNSLYVEGDPDHPADFESVAHFSRLDYQAFLSQHGAYRDMLEQNASIRGVDCFLAYRKLKTGDGQTVLDTLISELAKHDVNETPSADTYRRLAASRWKDFADQVAAAQRVSIFECCFLQNPLTVLLGKHNVAPPVAASHLQTIAAMLRPLQPALIYLRQQDVRAALKHIAQERPQAWKDFLISYFTGQGWGKASGLSGFEGVIAFYEMRQQVELDLLYQLDVTPLLVDTSKRDWAESQREITAFVGNIIRL